MWYYMLPQEVCARPAGLQYARSPQRARGEQQQQQQQRQRQRQQRRRRRRQRRQQQRRQQRRRRQRRRRRQSVLLTNRAPTQAERVEPRHERVLGEIVRAVRPVLFFGSF